MTSRRPAAVRLALVLALAVIGSLIAAGPAAAHHGHKGKDAVRFATFNASLNRNTEGQLIADLSTPANAQAADDRGDHPAGPARGPAHQRVRLRRAGDGATPLPGQLPLDRPERRQADPLPLSLHRALQHRHPVGVRPQQRRPRRRAGRRLRLRVLPGAVRDGGLLEAPDPLVEDPHVPALPLEGHAGSPPAGRSGDPGSRRLVLGRGAGRLPPLLQEPLGHPDRDRPQGRPLPRQPSDAARVRRARGPERDAQLRRDPFLGRLHHAWAREPLHLRRRGREGRAQAGLAVRHRGRRELRPRRRRLDPGRDPAAHRASAREHEAHSDERGGGRGLCPPGRSKLDPSRRPEVRHGGLRGFGAGQPSRRLRAPAQEPAHPRLRGLLAAPERSALPPDRRLPVPELGPPARLGRRQEAASLSRAEPLSRSC